MFLKSFIALGASATLVLAQSPAYGQCGGIGWTGATTCVSGSSCVYSNAYYSQCVPGAAATTTTPAVTTAHTSSASGSTSTSTTGLNIRLLPLGDSITFGVGSSDGNGYRNLLHNLLSPGNTVDFIGSIKAGTMADNDNEGHSGYTITQIAGTVSNSKALPARPNVVTLMAGTNDVYGSEGMATAPNRLSSLIDKIRSACPDAVVIVATLIPMVGDSTQVPAYNSAITQQVNQRASQGQHILIANMSAISVSDEVSDHIHPNDGGYVKMGNAWYAAIKQAAQKGWIGKPV